MTEELERAEGFHGHLGPWLVVGIRAGRAAMDALEARRYFGVRVEAAVPERPPVSCLLDGLQLSTGATTGKANLVVTRSDLPQVVVFDTETGRRARVEFPPDLSGRLAAWLAQDGDRESARRVWEAPLDELRRVVSE